jgi:glycosyltransferase involved in cell wall biosynthesis
MVSEADPAWPRITLLTPCLDAERYIAEVVATVERQQYPSLEHIVVDGGSLDTTLDILARHPAILVASERDKGSHDAMNKGLRLATGDVVGFINSDDLYGPDVLADIAQVFASDPALDVVVLGTVLFAEGPGSKVRLVEAHGHFTEQGFWLPELAFGAPGFNGRFFRRRVFERIGDFDLRYFFSADRQFLIRLALAPIKSRTLPVYGYYYRQHIASATLNPVIAIATRFRASICGRRSNLRACPQRRANSGRRFYRGTLSRARN